MIIRRECVLPLNESLRRFTLNEEFKNVDDLKSSLSDSTIELLNSNGDNWSLEGTDWESVSNKISNMSEYNALVEIYLHYLCQSCNINIGRLDKGKSILCRIFYELGFNKNNNPYIAFIRQFYSVASNKNFDIDTDGWTKLNDWYANDEIDAEDLMGTGLQRNTHLIFNKNLYSDSEVSGHKNEYMKMYVDMCRKTFVLQLNLYAIASYKNSPYKSLRNMTRDGTKGTGVYQGGDFREVRNVIFYKDPMKPLEDLHSYKDVYNAYTYGTHNKYSAEDDERAMGISSNDLRRKVSEEVKNIADVWKTLSTEIKNYANSTTDTEKRDNIVTQAMEDKSKIESAIKLLQNSTTKIDFDKNLADANALVDKINAWYKDKNIVSRDLSKQSVKSDSFPRKNYATLDSVKKDVDKLDDNQRKELVKSMYQKKQLNDDDLFNISRQKV